jgi:hypothetical protein
VSYPAPTWTDAVSGSGAAVCAPASGSTFPLGSTTVTCDATDGAGNAATAVAFTVTVVDTTPPNLTVPADLTNVPATSAAGAPVSYSATATDLVSTPTVSCAPASGSTFAIGTTAVLCTATDAAGNGTQKSFTVTVVDQTVPATLTANVTPTTIWPPDGSITNVTVSGQVVDNESGAASISWSVLDEYGTYQPSGAVAVSNGPFSFPVPLLRERRGNDKNGRHYTIRLTAYDRAGNARALATPLVVNVHDQSK